MTGHQAEHETHKISLGLSLKDHKDSSEKLKRLKTSPAAIQTTTFFGITTTWTTKNLHRPHKESFKSFCVPNSVSEDKDCRDIHSFYFEQTQLD